MQLFLALFVIAISAVSSYRFTRSAASTIFSTRFTNVKSSRIARYSTAESTDADNQVISAVPKLEQIIDMTPDTKKVAEWRDPVAVAAENKGPFDDMFPGGKLSPLFIILSVMCILLSCADIDFLSVYFL